MRLRPAIRCHSTLALSEWATKCLRVLLRGTAAQDLRGARNRFIGGSAAWLQGHRRRRGNMSWPTRPFA